LHMENDSTNWFVKDFGVRHSQHIKQESKLPLFDLYLQ